MGKNSQHPGGINQVKTQNLRTRQKQEPQKIRITLYSLTLIIDEPLPPHKILHIPKCEKSILTGVIIRNDGEGNQIMKKGSLIVKLAVAMLMMTAAGAAAQDLHFGGYARNNTAVLLNDNLDFSLVQNTFDLKAEYSGDISA